MRVLVAEDDGGFRGGLVDRLQRWGYATLESASETDALARIGAGDEFDIAILDMKMEHHNSGLILLRRIVVDRPDVPCIILTAYNDLPDPDATTAVPTFVPCVEAGAFSFILKGWGDAAIRGVMDRARVRRILRGRRRLRDSLSAALHKGWAAQARSQAGGLAGPLVTLYDTFLAIETGLRVPDEADTALLGEVGPLELNAPLVCEVPAWPEAGTGDRVLATAAVFPSLLPIAEYAKQHGASGMRVDAPTRVPTAFIEVRITAEPVAGLDMPRVNAVLHGQTAPSDAQEVHLVGFALGMTALGVEISADMVGPALVFTLRFIAAP